MRLNYIWNRKHLWYYTNIIWFFFQVYQYIIDWKFLKISCEIVELEKNIMATSESIWPHCRAPAWYKLWYTFACNLRISFICYFQRETHISCYISRCQLDYFVFHSGFNFVNLKFEVLRMCNMWPLLFISTIWHVNFAKSRPLLKRMVSSIN